jgi:hypothetical protein
METTPEAIAPGIVCGSGCVAGLAGDRAWRRICRLKEDATGKTRSEATAAGSGDDAARGDAEFGGDVDGGKVHIS